MKFRRLFKKAAATLMAAVTALSVLPATTAFAAGDIGTISFAHTYDSSGNAMRYNSSAVFDGYTAGGTGEYKYRMFVDGENAFCIQPGVPLKTGNTLKKASSDTWNALSANQKKAVGLALLYGYQGNRSHLSGSDDEKWLATQTLVWEFVTGCREATGSYKQNSTKAYSLHFGSNYPNSGAKAAYDQIVSLMAKHNTIPSFMSGGKNDITKELAYKDGKYSITLTDKNGVLSDYSFSSSDGNVKVSRSGDKLTISSAAAVSGSVRITAKRNGVPTVSDSAKMIAYGDPNLQDLVTGVENADTVAAYLNIETPTGTIALKKTSEDGVVGGIQFNIKGDNFNKTVTTDKDGNITVEGLFPATYTITEQSIDRYEPQKSQTVTLIGGKTTTVNFNNTLKCGSLEVIKNSEDNLVEGVKFHLYGTSLSGLPVDEYAVTDAKGVAKFSDVLISGDTPYVVEEVDTAIRYVVSASQTAPIEWEKVTSRTFVNVLKKFNVTVTKTDAETGTPQGDASLAGAVYGIYKGEELIDTYTTDENGQFTIEYYVCGDDWTIREISPSEGYLLDPTVHKVGAEPELYTVEYNSAKNDVNEQVIKGNIAIIKHTDDGETQIETPEVGATFEVYLKSAGSFENAKETERDVLTCDENGFAQTKDMPYGIYTVHQTSGWEGRELMKDFDVFISADGQTYRFLINNANFESYIKIVKKDAETGNTIPYAGAGFQLYDPNGNLITMTFTYPEVTTIDTFYTTSDGYLITPQTLEYGKGYSLVEVQAPYGYVLDSEPVYFDVEQSDSTEESGITVIEVVRSNLAQKGTITVSKSGEMFSSVSENNGLYQPVYAVGGLEGAVYEITAAEDIYTLDGTLRAEKGEVVDTVTTGADGTAKSKELYLGKYEVREIEAPYGMVLNEEIHNVELVYAGQDVAVTETATSFYNERQRVEIDLTKSLEVDKDYGVGSNGEIFDVTFGLYAAEDLTAADGTVLPADGLIEIISFDENGYGKVATDLPFGSYYVREISTNSAYIISDQKYPVTFEYAGQDTTTVHITANEGEAIENKLIYGSVSGKKSDEDGKVLGGAVIGIFKSGTEEFTKENAIQTTTSKDDGSFSFAKVPYGTWIIREIESPKGFVLSEEEIAVTIGKVDEVVEIELVNYFIQGNIELTKVDKDYPDNKLSGAVFEVFADTNKNGEFNKDDELIGEMSEIDGGIYQMKELRYGKYFVREKTAPTGFVLDEKVYTVSIEEDGKTYVVENEAGKGFVNAAQTGSLKIVKTSSDGKLEGFSFRVTGMDYDKTFKTDKNGEIFIEDLRIGEYTVSEVNDKASAGYILPADKQATIKVDATTIVQMHNEFRDTPKTGDDFNPALWVNLAVVSLAGAGVLGFVGFKNRKKKED
ncbi:TPA: Cys-Gln thioester bond-forming surface protein [Clostridioides difficile]|uniref:SpaA isopeptide-forming pilin-related protein n=1 Tax=Clostridioides difficile TaxID=1496 RepID=UPI001186308E|nr:SpaA isopeptide-forming pilin-related protein [Clostridioides difficile]HBF4455501.1 Cys-Gln thioester bond-forming surface protein [Clostridioides difficile]HBF4713403.1 Cys-Gln thioester bond-forming surface protein [Clostridioides difficile]HBF5144066.1 Cys-Gln thioester bond-forming surface protein [Clostridioides difficile]HBF5351537.1 Cys-Gln thioester bond-forming surface protein [Clostridioides difficile]HBF8700316.1 Cys-Gln thioester bond-forming surface protein [Clostridioides dif